MEGVEGSGAQGIDGPERHRFSGAARSWVKTLVLTLALLALSCSSALAAVGHPFLSSLVLPGAEPRPVAAAVDSKSGDVFVADNSAGVVDVFSPSGAYLTQFGGGVLESNAGLTSIGGLAIDGAGRVYVADKHTVLGSTTAGTVYVFKPDGFGGYGLLSEWHGPVGTPFSRLVGVAVDSSTSSTDPTAGDVFVEDGAAATVYVLKPPPTGPQEAEEGTLVSTLTGAAPKFEHSGLQQANGVAASSSSGSVYVANSEKRVVEVFDPAGEFERSVNGSSTLGKSFRAIAGLAVEEPGEVLYVADSEAAAVDQLTASGGSLGRISVAAPGVGIAPLGVAVDNSSGPARGQVYVIDNLTKAVEVYGPAVPVPAVTTGKASAIERALGTGAITATLNGTIDPEGNAGSYHFEYREAGGSGSFAASPTEPVSGTTATEVHTALSLLPGRAYEFRLVGEDDAHKGTAGYGLVVPTKITPPAVSGVTTAAATSVGPTSATLTGALNPQSIATTYRFEYGETVGYGRSTAPVATSSKPAVSAEEGISGLTPGRTYHFRLAATNEFGTSYGPDATFTTTLAGAPDVSSESSETSGTGSETLMAQINPDGEASSYHFEYGEGEGYGQSTPEAGLEPPGASVSTVLTGLKPNTDYHYRVVAKNSQGETRGADATFSTGAAAASATPALLDGRAYELVSPPDKHGGYIEPLSRGGSTIQASEDGNALAYVDLGSVVEHPEGNLSPEPEEVLAARGDSNWSSQEIVTPTERVRGSHTNQGVEYALFSSNLSLGLLQPLPDSGSPLAEPPLTPPLSEAERANQQKTIYLRANPPLAPSSSQAEIYEEARQNGERLAAEHGEPAARPGYVALVNGGNTAPGTVFGGATVRRGDLAANLTILDATPDLTHIVIRSTVSLTPQPSAPGLYEWAAGKLQLISVFPSGEPAPGSGEELQLGSAEGAGPSSGPSSYRHAISDDGSRVIWTQKRGTESSLFLRDTSAAEGAGETIQLDKAAPGVNPTTNKVVFQDASADGSKVFFTDTAALTADAKATYEPNGGVEKPDLYECEVVVEAGTLTCRLSDLTAPSATAEPAAVPGVVAVSEDGSYVYVVATGVLASGAQPGADNLYVLHREGGAWLTRFVATLSGEDFPDWAPSLGFEPKVVEAVRQTARVSPDGRYLAFMSNRRLTGYDNTDVNEEGGPHADEEVFLYDASADSVVCSSCNPSGARPRGVRDQTEAGEGLGLLVDRVETWRAPSPGEPEFRKTDHWLAGSIPGYAPVGTFRALHQPRYLSDSGRMFFTSADALVPEAVGDTRPETVVEGGQPAAVGVENVYQYEPAGVGNCSSTSGCVALISSATSHKESALLDASASGDDVFFITDSKLLPQDVDSSYDVYDARVCSGSSPCQVPPTPPPPPCGSSEQCRGGGSAAETFQLPPSATFSGPGNATHLLATGGTLPAKASTPPRRAQKLAHALKACRRLAHRTHRQKIRRARCEAHARKLYGSRRRKK